MPCFAAVQMEPSLLQPQANLARMQALIAQAANNGAQVAVFPECVTTGYALTPEEAHELAQPVPGPWTEQLTQACRQTGLGLLAFGMLEQDETGRLFNSSVLLGPQGLLAMYRKTHLPYLGVDRYVNAGDKMPEPLHTSFGNVAPLICYDIRFPEPARALALDGVQVILISTAWPQAATLYPDFLIQTRAAENLVFLVAANRIGEERGARYLGHSLIVAPDGSKLAEASGDQEEILYADFDPNKSNQKHLTFVPGEYELDPIGDRRPELYGPLTKDVKPPAY